MSVQHIFAGSRLGTSTQQTTPIDRQCCLSALGSMIRSRGSSSLQQLFSAPLCSALHQLFPRIRIMTYEELLALLSGAHYATLLHSRSDAMRTAADPTSGQELSSDAISVTRLRPISHHELPGATRHDTTRNGTERAKVNYNATHRRIGASRQLLRLISRKGALHLSFTGGQKESNRSINQESNRDEQRRRMSMPSHRLER